MRTKTLLSLSLLVAACSSSPPPSSPPPAASSAPSSEPAAMRPPEPPAPPPLPFSQLPRARFNQLAVRLNQPLYWIADKNSNGAVDADEVASLLFYPTTVLWVDGGKLTPAFENTYASMLQAHETKIEPGPEHDRARAVQAELDGAASSLVLTDVKSMSADDKKLVNHMLTVASLIDDLYATQNGSKQLAGKVPDDPASKSLFRRNRGPACQTPGPDRDPSCSAIPGSPKPVVDVYPESLQKDPKFCDKLEKDKKAKKLLDPFAVVREEKGKLAAVPYNKAYGDQMGKIAAELEAAAADIGSPREEALKRYLQAAAKSFKSNDWLPADEAWSKMNAQNSAWYVRVGPDEVYWEPCSQKAGFHLTFARINPDSLRWQKKLEPVQQSMEDDLAALIGAPYKARKVTFHLPDFIDIVINAGDDRSPIGATIGQSLPNWGKVAKEGRGRTVAMSNLYTDPDSMAVRRSKASSWLGKETMGVYVDEQEPGLVSTILHEATHNLGPSHHHVYKGKEGEIAFGGELASMLEELKAQTGALYYVAFLQKKGIMSAETARRVYVDSFVWGLNHISRGMYTAEHKRKPYSQLAAVQLGFFIDEGAVRFDREGAAANGTDKGAFTIDFDKLPAAIDKLMKKVGGIKATNDRPAAESFAARYVDGDIVPHKLITERALRFPQPNFVYGLSL